MTTSDRAKQVLHIVSTLQNNFASKLQEAAKAENSFQRVEWLRDQGSHGGGNRLVANHKAFNRGSVNVSQIHYHDLPDKPLASATALSTIIHPANPHTPSMHMHISYTEMKSGEGYWRIMADLNPSLESQQAQKETFDECLKKTAPELYEKASAQGDRYFYIPALQRHRGVSHFYLEQYHTDDFTKDSSLADAIGNRVIDCYCSFLAKTIADDPSVSPEEAKQQLAYHTLYLFQVLTLDRGTTSGLLVHDQNDVGIMGSIPAFVDRDLLASWQDKVPEPQDSLVKSLVEALPQKSPCPVEESEKLKLAKAVRDHYTKYPEALALQARGDVLPPTVKNHRSD
jgi:coproporphyrinogen III oxidase